ncbi:MAG: DUF1573 domain-containing protein [Prevotellaceae bacterium]|nr:DUF1573 domain-containing protein [Prevotellaceae bacterium]MDY6131427.1 DUF1573 domain-containing protein [Prevotella sp.]
MQELEIYLYRKQTTFYAFEKKDTICSVLGFYNDTGCRQVIDTIMTSCKCTHVIYPHEIIECGQKGQVSVVVQLPEEGYFSESVVVYFHRQRPVTLKVMGRK